jgi:hypothetical protein
MLEGHGGTDAAAEQDEQSRSEKLTQEDVEV